MKGLSDMLLVAMADGRRCLENIILTDKYSFMKYIIPSHIVIAQILFHSPNWYVDKEIAVLH